VLCSQPTCEAGNAKPGRLNLQPGHQEKIEPMIDLDWVSTAHSYESIHHLGQIYGRDRRRWLIAEDVLHGSPAWLVYEKRDER
jgi:hypothetical protein